MKRRNRKDLAELDHKIALADAQTYKTLYEASCQERDQLAMHYIEVKRAVKGFFKLLEYNAPIQSEINAIIALLDKYRVYGE